MSQIRKDPITGRSVIIAPERAGRPNEFQARPMAARSAESCPFCPGHEAETPPELFSLRDYGSPNEPGWRVRIIPNKYPALASHEVIIEASDHEMTLADIPAKQAAEVLCCYRDRIRHLADDERVAYVMVFKNQGESAGATIEHTHTQVLALPMVPMLVQEEVSGARCYHERTGACFFCELAYQEAQERRVLESASCVAIAPYASRFPYETWIVPRLHHSHFEAVDGQLIGEVASLLQETVRRINLVLSQPSYNVVVHTAPLRDEPLAHYHWHIEVIPRLNKIGGFEWGTGVYINPTPPEEAAWQLRRSLG